MADDNMTAPFVLGLIGGIWVVIVGIVAIWIAHLASQVATIGGLLTGQQAATSAASSVLYGGAIAELVLGIVILVGSILLRTPEKAKMGSIIVLICAIISLVNIFGYLGGIIGPILAIVGGALGISRSK